MGDKVVVAFNQGDTVHFVGGNSPVCHGLMILGGAFAQTNNLTAWTVIPLSPPNGTAAVYGDPSVVAVSTNGSTISFFLSALSVSEASWQRMHPDPSNCLPSGDFGAGIDQVCVWRACVRGTERQDKTTKPTKVRALEGTAARPPKGGGPRRTRPPFVGFHLDKRRRTDDGRFKPTFVTRWKATRPAARILPETP
jgi:hypothetical protein